MQEEKNISGISENLSDSIAEQKLSEKKEIAKSFLYRKKIAISVSRSEEIEKLGLSKQHVTDVSIEIARYLIVNGATFLYGGDLNVDFTEFFADLAYQYKYLSDKEPCFVNYIHFLNTKNITLNDKVTLRKKQVEPILLNAPKTLIGINTEVIGDPRRDTNARYITGESLSDMRIKMSNESDARIVLGGRQKGFTGYLPGIVEEAYHTLKANKPLYLLGGFGGAAKSIIDIISGNDAKELTNEFQYDTEFLISFREFAKDKSTVILDYKELISFFRKHPIEVLSKQNGLTTEENQILFESTNIHELVFLIMKGLQKISSTK